MIAGLLNNKHQSAKQNELVFAHKAWNLKLLTTPCNGELLGCGHQPHVNTGVHT